jgi:hypothetical protein
MWVSSLVEGGHDERVGTMSCDLRLVDGKRRFNGDVPPVVSLKLAYRPPWEKVSSI